MMIFTSHCTDLIPNATILMTTLKTCSEKEALSTKVINQNWATRRANARTIAMWKLWYEVGLPLAVKVLGCGGDINFTISTSFTSLCYTEEVQTRLNGLRVLTCDHTIEEPITKKVFELVAPPPIGWKGLSYNWHIERNRCDEEKRLYNLSCKNALAAIKVLNSDADNLTKPVDFRSVHQPVTDVCTDPFTRANCLRAWCGNNLEHKCVMPWKWVQHEWKRQKFIHTESCKLANEVFGRIQQAVTQSRLQAWKDLDDAELTPSKLISLSIIVRVPQTAAATSIQVPAPHTIDYFWTDNHNNHELRADQLQRARSAALLILTPIGENAIGCAVQYRNNLNTKTLNAKLLNTQLEAMSTQSIDVTQNAENKIGTTDKAAISALLENVKEQQQKNNDNLTRTDDTFKDVVVQPPGRDRLCWANTVAADLIQRKQLLMAQLDAEAARVKARDAMLRRANVFREGLELEANLVQEAGVQDARLQDALKGVLAAGGVEHTRAEADVLQPNILTLCHNTAAYATVVNAKKAEAKFEKARLDLALTSMRDRSTQLSAVATVAEMLPDALRPFGSNQITKDHVSAVMRAVQWLLKDPSFDKARSFITVSKPTVETCLRFLENLSAYLAQATAFNAADASVMGASAGLMWYPTWNRQLQDARNAVLSWYTPLKVLRDTTRQSLIGKWTTQNQIVTKITTEFAEKLEEVKSSQRRIQPSNIFDKLEEAKDGLGADTTGATTGDANDCAYSEMMKQYTQIDTQNTKLTNQLTTVVGPHINLQNYWKTTIECSVSFQNLSNLYNAFHRLFDRCVSPEKSFQSWLRGNVRTYRKGTDTLLTNVFDKTEENIETRFVTWYGEVDQKSIEENAEIKKNINQTVDRNTNNRIINFKEALNLSVSQQSFERIDDKVSFTFDKHLRKQATKLQKLLNKYQEEFIKDADTKLINGKTYVELNETKKKEYVELVTTTKLVFNQLAAVLASIDNDVSQSFIQERADSSAAVVAETKQKSTWISLENKQVVKLQKVSDAANKDSNFADKTNYLYMDAWDRDAASLQKMSTVITLPTTVHRQGRPFIKRYYAEVRAGIGIAADVTSTTMTIGNIDTLYFKYQNSLNGDYPAKKALMHLLNQLWLDNRNPRSGSAVFLIENVDVETLNPNLIKRIEPVLVLLDAFRAVNASKTTDEAWITPIMRTYDVISLVSAMMSLSEEEHIDIYSQTLDLS